MSSGSEGSKNRSNTTTGGGHPQSGGGTTMTAEPDTMRDGSTRPGDSRRGQPDAGTSVALQTDTGTTRIADSVVAKVAGLAARDIPGVFAMGTGMARRVGQLKNLIPGTGEAATQGVAVEVGEREAAIDLNLVTWYGQSIVDISDAVRRNVIGQVEGMTGLKVVEVNIQIDDIHVETDDGSQRDQPQRVQ
jgi:uncharacterized alkaline shock family protein YloU